MGTLCWSSSGIRTIAFWPTYNLLTTHLVTYCMTKTSLFLVLTSWRRPPWGSSHGLASSAHLALTLITLTSQSTLSHVLKVLLTPLLAQLAAQKTPTLLWVSPQITLLLPQVTPQLQQSLSQPKPEAGLTAPFPQYQPPRQQHQVDPLSLTLTIPRCTPSMFSHTH